MLKPPLVLGAYPVTALMEALGVQIIASVLNVPLAETVTAVAHAPEAIELVPRLAVPLATVIVPVPGGVAHEPSALRKLVVPPPELGTTPCSDEEN
jgi:hypothetical protein